ncbi:YlxM family DNA-binding protein [Anaeromicropila populeti]|uniref:YlxM family DNA-binding protein n=1 Tax=Anaeromicropila populeti TaxID=37658 RepID=UPI0038BB56CA
MFYLEVNSVVELSLLYDFYGGLMKDNKRRIFEDYVLNDYSLSEIAKEQGISRQGVHDTIKRCTKELRDYEEKLCLIEKFQKTKEMVNQIRNISKNVQESGNMVEIAKIETLSAKILEEY